MTMLDLSTSQAQALRGEAHKGLPSESLTFRLGGEEYGIDILRVQAIRSDKEQTRIANAGRFIKGIASPGERMLILMDPETLMSSTEMGLTENVSGLHWLSRPSKAHQPSLHFQ